MAGCQGRAERARLALDLCAAPGFLESIGVTRVGDLTGLDTVGLPVWFAVRPNSRTVAVSQGKGLTHEQARISAVMEAAESAAAEAPERLIADYCSLTELVATGRMPVPLDRMSCCMFGAFDPDRERAWVAGRSWRTGLPVYAPYELVGLDMRVDAPWDRDCFRISSIGLGAAMDWRSAALHALLELVENDGIAPLETFGVLEAAGHPLRHEAGHHAGLDEAVDKLGRAGIRPVFHDLSGRVDVPVVGCFIPRNVADGSGPGTRYSAGFACRFNAHEAALAALLEAVQSRGTHISGARDDIDARDYLSSARAIALPGPDAPGIAELEASFDDEEPGLDRLAEKVGRAVGQDVYIFPLSEEAEPIQVVRVLVPDLRAVFEDGMVVADADLIGRFLDAGR